MTSFTKRIVAGSVAGLGVLALLTACGSAPSTSGSSASGSTAGSAAASAKTSSFLPCVVGDVGGFNDHSFNQLSLQGVEAAAKSLGGTYKKVQSQTSTDYAPAFASLVAQKCNVIVAAGFQFPAAMKASATANPSIKYVIIDDNSLKLANVKDEVFQTSEAAFLGGYAAAAYADSKDSSSPKVATWGGAKYPSVTIYMDGVADGVAYYNSQKKKNVGLLGWNESTQNGSFVGDFTSQNKAQQLTAGFLQQGAEVVIPVAGSLYQGAAKAITSAKSTAVLEGVDADLYETDPSVKSLILTSILKKVDTASQDGVELAAKGGTFDNSTYIGTLKNGGVGLSSFHDFASKIPSSLTGDLATIQTGIENGTIQVASPSAFK